MGAIITQETKELYMNLLQVNQIKKDAIEETTGSEAEENLVVVRNDRRPAVMVVQTFLSKGGTLIKREEKPFLYDGAGGDVFDQAYLQILPSFDVVENVFEEGQVATQ